MQTWKEFLRRSSGWSPKAAILRIVLGTLLSKQRDFSGAVLWLTRAAEANHPVAQNNLGLLYCDGTGVATNFAVAIRWFERASSRWIPIANQGKATKIYLQKHGLRGP